MKTKKKKKKKKRRAHCMVGVARHTKMCTSFFFFFGDIEVLKKAVGDKTDMACVRRSVNGAIRMPMSFRVGY